MKSILTEAYDPEHFRKSGHELIDLIADYLEKTVRQGSGPVMDWQEPQVQLDFWQNYQLEDGNITGLFEDIIQRSIHIHHPQYMGHQVGAPLPLSALSAILSALLNNGMAVYEMGPAATAIEKVVIDTFTKALGYGDTADGYLTSGGSLANLTALLAARKAKAGTDIWQEGYSHKLAVMVSAEAHYCIDRAARIMGLGSEGIIKIPVNENFYMRTELLEACYREAQQKGLKVIAVIGSACSTSTGTYDNLEEIGAFCSRHDLWFHIDGAHGGAVIFSEKYKHLVKGIEQADSVAIDCHKMLMTPALTTALLFKHTQLSYTTFSQKAQYLWSRSDDFEWYNLAKRTFECTKVMMSIKFFTTLKLYGIKIFDENVSRLYDLGKTFASLIRNRTRFELALEPVSNIVCFRLVAESADETTLNHINSHIREAILEKGDYYIVQTTLHDTVYLRTTLMNPFTTEAHLNGLLDTLENLAAAMPDTSLRL